MAEVVLATGPGGGTDRARGDQVDADATGGGMDGQRAGERREAGLRGAVGVAAEVVLAVDGADVDDGAPAAGWGSAARALGAPPGRRLGEHGAAEGDVDVLVSEVVGLVLEERGVGVA
jgi:hypothetical protein